MIHFLGKIHLEYAEAKPLGNSVNKNPDQYIRIVDKGLADIVDIATHEINILNAVDLQQVVEKFGTFDKFIDFLAERASKDRVLIYCDEESMIEMLCSLWKSLFPKITKETARRFFNSVRDSEHLKIDDSNEYIDISLNSERLQKDEFIDQYWDLSEEKLERIFNKAETFSLEGREELVGLEYILMKKILNESEYSETYNKKIDFLYRKNLVKEILFMGAMIKEHYMYYHTSDPYASAGAISVYDELKKNADLKIIFDKNVGFSSETYHYIKNNYNLKDTLEKLSSICKKIHKKINPDFVSVDEFNFENPITEYIVKHGKEPRPMDLIDYRDHMNIKNYHLLRGFVHMGTLNHYLLQSFYAAIKQNQDFVKELK